MGNNQSTSGISGAVDDEGAMDNAVAVDASERFQTALTDIGHSAGGSYTAGIEVQGETVALWEVGSTRGAMDGAAGGGSAQRGDGLPMGGLNSAITVDRYDGSADDDTVDDHTHRNTDEVMGPEEVENTTDISNYNHNHTEYTYLDPDPSHHHNPNDLEGEADLMDVDEGSEDDLMDVDDPTNINEDREDEPMDVDEDCEDDSMDVDEDREDDSMDIDDPANIDEDREDDSTNIDEDRKDHPMDVDEDREDDSMDVDDPANIDEDREDHPMDVDDPMDLDESREDYNMDVDEDDMDLANDIDSV